MEEHFSPTRRYPPCPNECNQIPSDAFGDYDSGWWGWPSFSWKNEKGDSFDGGLTLNAEGIPDLILDISVDMRIKGSLVKVKHRVNQEMIHEAEEIDDDWFGSPFKDVKKVFGSGDNCGESDSGANENGNP